MLRPLLLCQRQDHHTRVTAPSLETLESRLLLAGDITGNVVINEFMADNENGLRDFDNRRSDWIELRNDDVTSINIQDWFLTDDRNNLMKWKVPVETTLPPQEHLVIFASGRNRVMPDGQLHTSFRLSSQGEYLALVRPGGEIAWEVNTSFPQQHPDVSYGTAPLSQTTPLISEGDAAKVFVPNDNILGTSWTAVTFDDAAWSDGTTAIGYGIGETDAVVSGFTTHMIDVNGGIDGEINTATEARLLLSGRVNRARHVVTVDVTTQHSGVNFGGGEGTFAGRNPYPNGVTSEDLSDIAISATTTVTIPEGDWTIGFGSSDGGFLELKDVSFLETFNEIGSARPGDDQIIFSGQRAGGWTRGTFSIGPGGMTTELEAIFFEREGGDFFELAIAGGHESGDVDPATWQLLEDGTFGWNLETPATPALPELIDQLAFSVANEMFGKHTSTYARLAFMVTDAAKLDLLTLRMNYRDAFVAYINGVEVARSNVTGAPTYESVADEVRNDSVALITEEFDISQHVRLLQDGANVLSVHGISANTNVTGFLILPKLAAQETLAGENGFMAKPTAGQPNQAASLEVVSTPTYSVPAGTFTDMVSLELTSTSEGTEIRFTSDGTQPTTESTLYEGPIEISETTQIRARAFKLDQVPSPVYGQSYIKLADDVQDFTSNIPILVLENFDGGSVSKASMVDFNFSLFTPDTETGRSSLNELPEVSTRLGVKTRGQTSQNFPKQPYRIEIRDENDNDLDMSLLGLPPDSDYVLFGPWADKSLIRNSFAYNLARELGTYSPRTRQLEVFVNVDGESIEEDDYVGVYTLLEAVKVSSSRVDVTPLLPSDVSEPEINGGYLLRNESGAWQREALVSSVEELELVNSEDYTPAQFEWIGNYIDEFHAALFSDNFTDLNEGYAKYIDVDSFVRNIILNELLRDQDSYVRSDYLHMERGGKLTRGPQFDQNLIMGVGGVFNNTDTFGWALDQNWMKNTHGWQQRLLKDPDFSQRVIDRWQAERQGGLLDRDNYFARIDAHADPLAEAAVRNFDKWDILRSGSLIFSTPVSNTWERQIDIMKDWVSRRMSWIDGQFIEPPKISLEPGDSDDQWMMTISAPQGYIYYMTDGTDPRSPGGGIASGAALFERGQPPLGFVTPVAIDKDAHVVVRAFNRSNVSNTSEFRYKQWSSKTELNSNAPRPPVVGDLVISEVHYNPAGSNTAVGEPDVGNDEFEFLEVTNASGDSLELDGVRLSQTDVNGDLQGIRFTFAPQSLTPGASVVIVHNHEAFNARYGNDIPIALGSGDSSTNDGEYSGRLSNGGEQLTLLADNGAFLQQFDYDDNWYNTTDGDGPSLEVTDVANPDLALWNEASTWRASFQAGGSPGLPVSWVDFTGDGILDVNDVDTLQTHIHTMEGDPKFDLTGDGAVDEQDLQHVIQNVLGTRLGDSDLDRDVDFEDFVALTNNFNKQVTSWSEADFNGDGLVSFVDFNLLATNFGFNHQASEATFAADDSVFSKY